MEHEKNVNNKYIQGKNEKFNKQPEYAKLALVKLKNKCGKVTEFNLKNARFPNNFTFYLKKKFLVILPLQPWNKTFFLNSSDSFFNTSILLSKRLNKLAEYKTSHAVQ